MQADLNLAIKEDSVRVADKTNEINKLKKEIEKTIWEADYALRELSSKNDIKLQ